MAKDNHLGVDLTEFSREEVSERIREYLGQYELGSPGLERITDAAIVFFKMADQGERRDALSALGAFFCSECGSGFLPCYCMRDD